MKSKKDQRFISFILAVIVMVGLFTAIPGINPIVSAVSENIPNSSLTWELTDNDTTLTISGVGPMPDYTPATPPPWYDYRYKIKDVDIDNGVTSIGERAFASCSSLTNITVPDSVTSIENYAFAGCGSLTGITIPDSVTSIGNHAFYYCSSLTGITVPDSVIFVGNSAFAGCISLIDATIGNSVKSIENLAFYSCSSLTGITIPDSITSIGIFAFAGCNSLTSITIPDSVTSVGKKAFELCSNLFDVYFKSNPPPTADNSAFEHVKDGARAIISHGATAYGTEGSSWNGLIVEYGGVTLNESSITITIGSTKTLTATITPDNATNKAVTWSSSNESIATVDNGTVTAAATGAATITVTTLKGKFVASCTVNVVQRNRNPPPL